MLSVLTTRVLFDAPSRLNTLPVAFIMAKSPQASILRKAGLEACQVLVPTDAKFAARQASYWSRSARSLQLACIVQPQSTQDDAAVVRSLVAAKIIFAVRSGGHTAWAGANNIGSDDLKWAQRGQGKTGAMITPRATVDSRVNGI